MNFQPHQKRVVDEELELTQRLRSLNEFIGSQQYLALDPVERSLLREQSDAMTQYQSCLCRRMGHWVAKA
jgi:hypothetical protein